MCLFVFRVRVGIRCLCYYIIYYIIYYTYIIILLLYIILLYTILYIISYTILSSSFYLPFLFCSLLFFPYPLPIFYLPPPLSSQSFFSFLPLFPNISSSFILYLSVLTYTYLYSFQYFRLILTFDPACFIGVDG